MWITLSATSEESCIDIYELIDEMTDFYEVIEECGNKENQREQKIFSVGDYVAVQTNEFGKTSWQRGRILGMGKTKELDHQTPCVDSIQS